MTIKYPLELELIPLNNIHLRIAMCTLFKEKNPFPQYFIIKKIFSLFEVVERVVGLERLSMSTRTESYNLKTRYQDVSEVEVL